jgi:hypothetical protein
MLRLAKTEINTMQQQRLTRMMQDTLALSRLSNPEIRAAYSDIEAIRDALSGLLDKVDGK